MAVTFDNLISQVKQQLLGYTKNQVSLTTLTQPMTATDTTFTVDTETVTALSRGLIEIGDELILLKKFDRTSGVATIFGSATTGRGVEGTTAATHAIDDLVTADPDFPRVRIKEAINQTITALFPDLFVIGEYEFPWQSARYEYPLPVEVERVYRVTSNTIGPSGVWFPNTSWRFNPQASIGSQVLPTPTPTGKSLQVMRDFIVPGRNVRVVYMKKPNTLTNNSDAFETTTGFPERYIDLVVYGACWRLLPAYDSGRIQQQSIEATERAPLVPTGSASQISQYFLGLYQRRLNEERDRLANLYPTYQIFNG